MPKRVLAEAVASGLPEIVRNRRAKQGFTFPFGVWLQGRMQVASPFSESELACDDVFRAPEVARVRASFERGTCHLSHPWALMVATNWMATHKGTGSSGSRVLAESGLDGEIGALG